MDQCVLNESNRLLRKGLSPLDSIFQAARRESPNILDEISTRLGALQEELLSYHLSRPRGALMFLCVHCGNDILSDTASLPRDRESAETSRDMGWIREGFFCRECAKITEHQLVRSK